VIARRTRGPDFNVWFSEQQQRDGSIEYNYRRETPAPEPPPLQEPM